MLMMTGPRVRHMRALWNDLKMRKMRLSLNFENNISKHAHLRNARRAAALQIAEATKATSLPS